MLDAHEEKSVTSGKTMQHVSPPLSPPPLPAIVNHKHLKGPPGQNIPRMWHSMSVTKDPSGRKQINE